MSELTEQPQEEDKVERAEGNGVVEKGSVSIEHAEEAEPTESEIAQPTESAKTPEPTEVTETSETTEPIESGKPVESAEPLEKTETAETTEQVEKSDEQAAGPAETAAAPSEASDATDASPEAAAAATTSFTKGFVDEADGGELYGLILTVRNKVDGEYVERPEDLRPKQRWTVEYAMEEVAPERAHNLYKMLLKRRKNQLYPDDAEDRDDRWRYMFQGRLERYSTRGRKFRRRENKRLRQEPIHVYGSEEPHSYESVYGAATDDGGKKPAGAGSSKAKKKKE